MSIFMEIFSKFFGSKDEIEDYKLRNTAPCYSDFIGTACYLPPMCMSYVLFQLAKFLIALVAQTAVPAHLLAIMSSSYSLWRKKNIFKAGKLEIDFPILWPKSKNRFKSNT